MNVQKLTLFSLAAALVQAITPILLSVGILLSLFSAYSLPYEQSEVIIFSVICVVLFTICFFFKRRSLLLVLLFVVFAILGYLYRNLLMAGLYSVLSAIDEGFSTVLAVTVFPNAEFTQEAVSKGVSLFWFYLIFPLSFYFSCCCSLMKAPMLCYILALPLALLSVFFVDAPPQSSYLFIMLLSLLLVPMQQLSCQSNSNRIAIVNVLLTIVLALYAIVLKPISESLDMSWLEVEKLQSLFTISEGDSLQQHLDKPNNKDLQEAGSEEPDDSVVMHVQSSDVGTVYLRGYSLARYTGESWDSPANEYSSSSEPLLFSARAMRYSYPQVSASTLTVEYLSPSSLLHIPYFCVVGNEAVIGEDSISLAREITDYTVSYYPSLRFMASRLVLPTELLQAELNYRRYVYENYTADLPAIATYARNVAGITDTADREETIRQVVAHLTSVCTYDRQVEQAPDSTDVVLYFLAESRTGNCVHYASSATAMLQSLGIPARYVGGFRTDILRANTTVDVTVLDAHAWIEVYFDGIGWLPYEVTFSNDIMRPEPTAVPTMTPTPTQLPSSEPIPTLAPEDSATPTDASQTPSPDQAGETPVDEQKERVKIPTAVWIVLALLALVPLTVLRRFLKRSLRRKRWSRLSNNRYAISAYRYCKTLSALSLKMPPAVITLAKKARFSQHKLTDEERRQIELEVAAQVAAISTLPLRKRFVLAYILAEY